jgi:hypothetical protein
LEQVGEIERLCELCWDLARQLTWAYRFTEMATVVRRGLRALGPADSVHRGRLEVMLAFALCLSGRTVESASQLVVAARSAARGGDPAVVLDVAAMTAVHQYFVMRLPETATLGLQVAKPLRDSEKLWTLADNLAFVGVALAHTGRFAESDVVHAELEPLCQRLGHVGALSTGLRAQFAGSAARHGDLARLDASAGVVRSLAEETGNAGWRAMAHVQQGIVEFWRGDWAAALEHLDSAVELTGPFWAGAVHGFVLLVRSYCGETDAVVDGLERHASELPDPGRANLIGAWTLALLAAEAVSVIGDRAWAARLYPMVEASLRTGTMLRQYDARLITATAAMVADTAGLTEQADVHFRTAVQQADRLPHVIEQAATRFAYGRALLGRADGEARERGARLLDQARTGFRRLAMHRHEAMAAGMIAGPGPSTAARVGPW